MDISVIICTYNRAKSLARTLETLCSLQIPPGIEWELILVDNNSNDETRPVCDQFMSRLPMRYIFETAQGKSYALNRSMVEAKAPLFLFTDDDVDVEPQWLCAYYEAANRNPDVSIFGGPFPARFEPDAPRWFTENFEMIVPGQDMGPTEQKGKFTFVGGNLAMRRQPLAEIAGFRVDLGPDGTDTIRAEEIELENRLLAKGALSLYVPSAVIHHRIAQERTSVAFLRRWHFGRGMGEVRLGQVKNIRPWFGVPRYFLRSYVVNALIARLGRPFVSTSAWVRAEMEMAYAAGVISECRKERKQAAASK